MTEAQIDRLIAALEMIANKMQYNINYPVMTYNNQYAAAPPTTNWSRPVNEGFIYDAPNVAVWNANNQNQQGTV